MWCLLLPRALYRAIIHQPHGVSTGGIVDGVVHALDISVDPINPFLSRSPLGPRFAFNAASVAYGVVNIWN